MRIGCACHGDGAEIVLQAIRCFVLDSLMSRFLAHVRRETATLDHEIRDDAMENRIVVVTFIGLALEVGAGLGCGGSVKLESNDTFVGSNRGFHDGPC